MTKNRDLFSNQLKLCPSELFDLEQSSLCTEKKKKSVFISNPQDQCVLHKRCQLWATRALLPKLTRTLFTF